MINYKLLVINNMTLNWDRTDIETYIRDWIKYSRESIEAEQQMIKDGLDFHVPYTAARAEPIKAIFVISKRFKLDDHAKYMAIHLLDRYMEHWFMELVTSSESQGVSLQQIQEKMSSQLKLVVAVCVQIASKVDLLNSELGISQIQDLLQSIDPSRNYSKSTIYSCEIRILKTLNFRIPYCLPIHAIELFLSYTELAKHSNVRDICLFLLDIAYIHHNEIYEQLHLLARGTKYDKSSAACRNFMRVEVDSAFLAAAVLVCSNFFFALRKKLVNSLAAKLADLIDTSPVDINIMANIVFTMAIDEKDFKDVQGLALNGS